MNIAHDPVELSQALCTALRLSSLGKRFSSVISSISPSFIRMSCGTQRCEQVYLAKLVRCRGCNYASSTHRPPLPLADCACTCNPCQRPDKAALPGHSSRRRVCAHSVPRSAGIPRALRILLELKSLGAGGPTFSDDSACESGWLTTCTSPAILTPSEPQPAAEACSSLPPLRSPFGTSAQ